MVSYDLALGVTAGAGALYTATLGAAPDVYLEMDKTEKTLGTRSLVRAVAPGIAALSASAWMARKSGSEEMKRAACCSVATGVVGWGANNLYRVIKKDDSVAAKLDLGTTIILGGLCTAALMKNCKKD
mmetsp:Transcript_12787/g.32816  ORF Transcript_12787/g.32816 Transcript_12787/m.32816 type:complete len:128 (-) Transcript_12787:261-644(-)|eukprot:jgi/Tetstr1/423652/TSEL_014287.t1